MRTAILLVVPMAMFGCSGAETSVPPPSPRYAETPVLLSPGQYDFELMSLKADPNHQVMGIFRFWHSRKEPIRLWGFGFQDEKGSWTDEGSVFRPRFEQFRRKENGQWADVPVGYCGTGAEEYAIQPNRDYTFLIPLWPFVEKGTAGVVVLSGTRIKVKSTPFQTAECQKIAQIILCVPKTAPAGQQR